VTLSPLVGARARTFGTPLEPPLVLGSRVEGEPTVAGRVLARHGPDDEPCDIDFRRQLKRHTREELRHGDVCPRLYGRVEYEDGVPFRTLKLIRQLRSQGRGVFAVEPGLNTPGERVGMRRGGAIVSKREVDPRGRGGGCLAAVARDTLGEFSDAARSLSGCC
jgi:hypothetical protein